MPKIVTFNAFCIDVIIYLDFLAQKLGSCLQQ